jgi:heme/copper-type cytochrome/quinol oxidase subunit 3
MDTKAIIDEVARRHKIRLDDDDPILSTVTAIEVVHRLFAEHLKILVTDVANQATDRLAAQIETARREIISQTDIAKSTASQIINDAGHWSAEKLKQVSLVAIEDIQAVLSATIAAIHADAVSARKAKQTAVFASIITICLGCAFLGGGIGFWLAGR